jgi:integrase
MFSLQKGEPHLPSIWKREKSPYWVCCYTSANGQRLKKSTKQKDRKKAWEVCLAIERAENHAKNGTLTEQAAKKIIGEILERTTGEPLHDYKVADWLTHWLDMKEQVRAGKTMDRYRQVIRDFVNSLGNRANLPLSHVTPKDVLAYRNSITVSGKAARTANLSVKVVSAAFNAAVRQHIIESNPATALESLPVKTEEKGTFTTAQAAKLVRAADGDWKGAILLGYYTGARLGDVANMRWSAIDWTNKIVRFTASKTGKPVTLPLHPQLERELLKNPGVGQAAIFPSLAGRGTGGKHGLSGQFAAVMEKAGVEGKRTKASGTRTLSSLSFHSLRHSFNSALANAGVSQEIRQKLTGHASAEMNTIYTHHELAPLRAAVEKLPALGIK